MQRYLTQHAWKGSERPDGGPDPEAWTTVVAPSVNAAAIEAAREKIEAGLFGVLLVWVAPLNAINMQASGQPRMCHRIELGIAERPREAVTT